MKKYSIFLSTLAISLAACGPRVTAGAWSPLGIDDAQDDLARDPETPTEAGEAPPPRQGRDGGDGEGPSDAADGAARTSATTQGRAPSGGGGDVGAGPAGRAGGDEAVETSGDTDGEGTTETNTGGESEEAIDTDTGGAKGAPAANVDGDRPAGLAARRPPQGPGPPPNEKPCEGADEVGARPGRRLPGSLHGAPGQPTTSLPAAVRRAVRQALQAALAAPGGGLDWSGDDRPRRAVMFVRSSGGGPRRPHRHLMMRPLEVAGAEGRTHRLTMPAPARVRLRAATTRRPPAAQLTFQLREGGRRGGHTFQFTVDADAAFRQLLASRPEDGPAGEELNLGHLRRLTFVGQATSAAPRAATNPGPPSGRGRVAGL